MDIEQLMERLGRSGVTVIVKVDDERMAKGGESWTVVMSGPAVGEQGFIRAESSNLDSCLELALGRLRDRGDGWEWLVDFS